MRGGFNQFGEVENRRMEHREVEGCELSILVLSLSKAY